MQQMWWRASATSIITNQQFIYYNRDKSKKTREIKQHPDNFIAKFIP